MNSINDFAGVYIVNLAHRADRRKEISEQLALIGLSFASPNVTLFDAILPPDAGDFDSIGARGCFMSHLGVLRLTESLDNVLIIEDDLDFVNGIDIVLSAALEKLPENWGIFYGGCLIDLAADDAPITRVPPSTSLRTSHFVAFNGPVIAPMIEYLEAILRRPAGHLDGGPMHVDGAYSRFRADNPDVMVFAAIPELGYQRPSRTDIHALKWFDRVPMVKGLVQLIRRQRALGKRRAAKS